MCFTRNKTMNISAHTTIWIIPASSNISYIINHTGLKIKRYFFLTKHFKDHSCIPERTSSLIELLIHVLVDHPQPKQSADTLSRLSLEGHCRLILPLQICSRNRGINVVKLIGLIKIFTKMLKRMTVNQNIKTTVWHFQRCCVGNNQQHRSNRICLQIERKPAVNSRIPVRSVIHISGASRGVSLEVMIPLRLHFSELGKINRSLLENRQLFACRCVFLFRLLPRFLRKNVPVYGIRTVKHFIQRRQFHIPGMPCIQGAERIRLALHGLYLGIQLFRLGDEYQCVQKLLGFRIF